MITDIISLARENIRNMQPYSSARDEYQGAGSVFLDANENPYGSPANGNLNRYPDPRQKQLKEKIARIKGVPANNIFLGNGSDEAIDLLLRIFCEPARDNMVIMPPTYGMYEVCAAINNVAVKKVPLTSAFQPDLQLLEQSIDPYTKIIFICSPNNPTGNSINHHDIDMILSNFDGIVVIDEAYINFARQRSFISALTEFPNLVILQTFSKAWGLASARVGLAFAGQPVIDLFNKVKFPYNVNGPSQDIVNEALDNIQLVNSWISQTVLERARLEGELREFSFVVKVYPSDANFILVKLQNANAIFSHLLSKGIIVRNRSGIAGCEECLRITIGTSVENDKLISALKEFQA